MFVDIWLVNTQNLRQFWMHTMDDGMLIGMDTEEESRCELYKNLGQLTKMSTKV